MNRVVNLILKRSNKHRLHEDSNSELLQTNYNLINTELENGTVNENRIDKFFATLTYNPIAESMVPQIISIIEKCNSTAPLYANLLTNIFTKNIIPCIDNYKGVSKEIKNYVLTESQQENINEAVNDIALADRIYHNHQTISKRFNIEEKMKLFNLKDTDRIVNEVCELISTYDVDDYQKMNITIEEMTYMIEKEGMEYNPQELYDSITNYYLVNTQESVDNIRRVLEENRLIDRRDVEKMINKLKTSTGTTSMKNIFFQYVKDKDNVTKIMEGAFRASDNYDILTHISEFCKVIKASETPITESIYTNIYNRNFSRDELLSIYDTITESCDGNAELTQLADSIYEKTSMMYSKANLEAIQFLSEGKIADAMAVVTGVGFIANGLKKAAQKFNKFLNRRKASQYEKLHRKERQHNKYGVAKAISRIPKLLFGESANIPDDIRQCLDCYGRLDIPVAMYEIAEGSDYNMINDYMDSIIREFNSELLCEDTESDIRCYYLLAEGVAEIHIMNRIPLDEMYMLTLEDYTEPNDSKFQNTLNIHADNLFRVSDIIEKHKTSKLCNIVECIDRIPECFGFTIAHYKMAMEALQYITDDRNLIQEFCNTFKDKRFNESLQGSNFSTEEEKAINRIYEEWEPIEHDNLDVTLEAMDIFVSIIENCLPENVLEASDIENRMRKNGFYTDADEKADKKRNGSKDEDDDDDEDEDVDGKTEDDEKTTEKKATYTGADKVIPKSAMPDDHYAKPKKKFSLNNIRLALKGLNAKLKGAANEHRTKVKMFDASVRRYVKNIQDARSNERREQIIKGSVIPSFSKCMRFAILLAGMGVGVATGIIPVMVPVITAIGGLALDKHLTEKEKMLLLDEIDTELDVIDKELQLADNNNQLNKYRALMRYKKDLQRQYQRIRYNIRVGKDMHPSASVGMQVKAD